MEEEREHESSPFTINNSPLGPEWKWDLVLFFLPFVIHSRSVNEYPPPPFKTQPQVDLFHTYMDYIFHSVWTWIALNCKMLFVTALHKAFIVSDGDSSLFCCFSSKRMNKCYEMKCFWGEGLLGLSGGGGGLPSMTYSKDVTAIAHPPKTC